MATPPNCASTQQRDKNGDFVRGFLQKNIRFHRKSALQKQSQFVQESGTDKFITYRLLEIPKTCTEKRPGISTAKRNLLLDLESVARYTTIIYSETHEMPCNIVRNVITVLCASLKRPGPEVVKL